MKLQDPRDRRHGPGAWPTSTRRCVDVDDGRDQPPGGTDRAPLAAGVGQLSPVQRAYSAYTRHAIGCDACRDVDQKCETAEALWRTYRTVSGAACDRIADAGR